MLPPPSRTPQRLSPPTSAQPISLIGRPALRPTPTIAAAQLDAASTVAARSSLRTTRPMHATARKASAGSHVLRPRLNVMPRRPRSLRFLMPSQLLQSRVRWRQQRQLNRLVPLWALFPTWKSALMCLTRLMRQLLVQPPLRRRKCLLVLLTVLSVTLMLTEPWTSCLTCTRCKLPDLMPSLRLSTMPHLPLTAPSMESFLLIRSRASISSQPMPPKKSLLRLPPLSLRPKPLNWLSWSKPNRLTMTCLRSSRSWLPNR